MANRIIELPSGQKVCLVPRDQLKVKGPHRMAHAPTSKLLGDPTPPTLFDFTKGRALKFPILGNDQYGDCYYAAICHGSQIFTGNASTECAFDVNAVTARYQVLSGGDNGLGDDQAMPEWLGGIVGPNGPRKILDWMVVPFRDKATWKFMFWFNGGLIWTCALLDTWLNNISPGAIWDANGSPDPSAGHAMMESGINAAGNGITETWAIDPGIQVTPAGYAAADSEFIAAVSADQFNPTTGLHFSSGLSWDAHKAIWMAHGGRDYGPSPFPPLVSGPPFKLFEGTMTAPVQVGTTSGYPDLPSAETDAHTIADTDQKAVMIHDASNAMVETVQPNVTPPPPPGPVVSAVNLSGTLLGFLPISLTGTSVPTVSHGTHHFEKLAKEFLKTYGEKANWLAVVQDAMKLYTDYVNDMGVQELVTDFVKLIQDVGLPIQPQ